MKRTQIPIRQITTAHKHQNQTSRFSIRDLRGLQDGKGMVHDLHRHNFFFILVVEKGRGTHEIDFIKYAVQDRTVFFLSPGQVHHLELKPGSTGFVIQFDASFYQPENVQAKTRWRRARIKNYCRPEESRCKRMMALLHHMFREFTAREDGFMDAITAYLEVFILEFTRQGKGPQVIPDAIQANARDRFEEFMELLESRVMHMKQVSRYAHLMHLSVFQLNAVTKTATGKTASGLIREQLLLEAKRRLLATPDQVKDIASQLGYEDPSYFIRFFRKHTGYAPDVYRSHYR